jgi:hypothetical protein
MRTIHKKMAEKSRVPMWTKRVVHVHAENEAGDLKLWQRLAASRKPAMMRVASSAASCHLTYAGN